MIKQKFYDNFFLVYPVTNVSVRNASTSLRALELVDIALHWLLLARSTHRKVLIRAIGTIVEVITNIIGVNTQPILASESAILLCTVKRRA
jgi:hypothetical protein